MNEADRIAHEKIMRLMANATRAELESLLNQAADKIVELQNEVKALERALRIAMERHSRHRH